MIDEGHLEGFGRTDDLLVDKDWTILSIPTLEMQIVWKGYDDIVLVNGVVQVDFVG